MRGLGYRPDREKRPGESPDWKASFRGAPTPPPAHHLRELVLGVLDQGPLGSCVAQAGMQAIRMRELAQGVSKPTLGSRLWGYYLARATEHTTSYDAGASLRSLFDVLRKLGYPSEEFWPYDPLDTGAATDAFRVMPPTAAFWAAYDKHQPVRYERVAEVGNARIQSVKSAIAAGYPVCFGCDVSNAFCDGSFVVSEPLKPPTQAEVRGGHAMIFAGYDGDRFLVLNSWGTDFGDAGYCWFGPEYVVECRDLWTVERVP